MRFQRLCEGDPLTIFMFITHAKGIEMNGSHSYHLGLEQRGLFEIPDVAGVQIRCTEGSLWITLDHDLRDIVLEPGDSFTGSDHRRALDLLRLPGRRPGQARSALDGGAAGDRGPGPAADGSAAERLLEPRS